MSILRIIRPGEANLVPQPHEDYGRLSIALDTAQTNTEILIHGDKLAKIKYDGSVTGCYFRIDHRHAAKIYAKEFKALNRRYARIYLTTEAQAGKVLVLQINELSVSEIEPDAKTYDADSLDAIKTDVAAIEIDVHDIHNWDNGGERCDVQLTDAINTDIAAIELLLTTIDADTEAMTIDAAAIEVLQGIDGGGDLQKVKEELEIIKTFQTVNGGGELNEIKEGVGLVVADTGHIKTAIQVMDDWDDGSNHCETKEYFSGSVYEDQKATYAAENTFSEGHIYLRHCIVYNNHATVTSFIGDSVAQRYPLAPGEKVTLEWVDLNSLNNRRSGGTNGSLVVLGTVK